jgi:hypothetical protein
MRNLPERQAVSDVTDLTGDSDLDSPFNHLKNSQPILPNGQALPLKEETILPSQAPSAEETSHYLNRLDVTHKNTISKTAFASFMCTVLGAGLFILIGFFPYLMIAGIILGHIALHDVKRTKQHGKGYAIAALIIGYLLVLVFAIEMVILVSGVPFQVYH